MPIRDLIITEASSSILEPISKQTTYILLTRLGLRNTFDNNVYITNDYTKPSQTSGDGHNALISADRCDVKMTVSWNPTEMKWDINSFSQTQAYRVPTGLDRTLMSVFRDPLAGVQLTEQMVPCTMVLEFSLQFKNRESAFATSSALNNMSFRDSVINVQNLAYDYPITVDLFAALYAIYQLRQPSLCGMEFWAYLQKYSKGAIQYIRQRVGSNVGLVIKRQSIRALGVIEHPQAAPTVQEQDSGIDRFVVDFTYTLQFARPDALRLQFPVVICNHMVPRWMIVATGVMPTLSTIHGMLQEMSISAYLRMTSNRVPIVVRRPEYDDFRPPTIPVVAVGFQEFFNAVVCLDDSETTSINLLDLGDGMALHATVVEIMMAHGPDIFDTTGLYNITIYCNDIPVDRSCLTIDENLVITLAMQDKNRRYHLVLSEATNLKAVDPKWHMIMIANRTFFPVTVIRNLQFFIDHGYCYIDHSNLLLSTINQAIQSGVIDQQIRTLITAGHLNRYAFEYAATAEQFCEYLIHVHSPITNKPAYDEYVALCIASGLILKAELATGYIRTSDGYPYLSLSKRGRMPMFNTPLRIISSTIAINSSQGPRDHLQ